MKEYSPIQFLAHLVEQISDNGWQKLDVKEFNEIMHKIEDSIWKQHFHIGFGFEEFALTCISKFPHNCQLDTEKLILTINKDDEFEKELNNYIKIYETPKYIRDFLSDYNDDEVEEFIKNNEFDHVFESTAEELLREYHAYSNIIRSWPSKTCEILKKLDPNQKVKDYRTVRDGWGCIYENVNIIEILKKE